MTADHLTTSRVQRVLHALPMLIGNLSQSADVQALGSLSDVLKDYYRVMEIAHYVRRGGIKAMIYRLETGRIQFAPVDYFDEANAKLAAGYRSVQKSSFEAPQTQAMLIDHLKSIGEDEEQAVTALLPQLDDLLLSTNRSQAAAIDELP